MLAWDHNAHYHHLLLAELPAHVHRVVDIGAGTGQLAAALATRADHVDALDRDPTVLAIAGATTPANVTCLLADLREAPLQPEAYDAALSVSALHHLDADELPRALSHLAAALRPGGVLAAVALPRVDLPRDLPVEVIAVVWHHVLGVVLRLRRHRLRAAATSPQHHGVVIPMRDPQLSTREVRRVATAVLPGARVRRLLLWRYLLIWHKPPATGR